MGNAKSKSSKYDSYTVKGPPARSNSDPSNIYFYTQKPNNQKSLKKHSKKSKKSNKTDTRTAHNSINSLSIPSSSSLGILNDHTEFLDPRGNIILPTSIPDNYSKSLPKSNKILSSARPPNNSKNLFQEDTSSKPGDYLNLGEEFNKLNFNFDTDLLSSTEFLNDSQKKSEKIKDQEDEIKRYTQYYGKSETKKPKSSLESESKKSYHSYSKHSEEELNKYSSRPRRDEKRPSEPRKSSKRREDYLDSKQSSRHHHNREENDIDSRQSSGHHHSREKLKKSSKRSEEDIDSKQSSGHHHSREELRKLSKRSEEDLDSRQSSRHRHSKDELRKPSNHNDEDSKKKPILEEYPNRRNDVSSKNHDKSYPSRKNDFISSETELRKSLPVPSTVELNRLSKDIMDDLKLPSESRDFINELPNSQKWELIQKYYNTNGNDTAEIYCISYTQKLKDNPFDKEAISDIATALHTHIVPDIIDKFINYGGLHLLLSNLRKLEEDDKHYGPNYDELESLYIQCIKAIMNLESGLENLMDDPKLIVVIALCLRSTSLRTRCVASEILAAVCMIPKGHNYVLQALTDFKEIAGETKRFETIVRGLILDRRRKCKNEPVDRDLQLASLSLINALVSGGNKLNIEFRTHLRYEFTNLGLLEIFDKLKSLNDSLINNQINIFEKNANNDEGELYKRFNCSSNNSDAVLLFESLNKSIKDTRCYKYFINMLKHTLLMPKDSGERTAMWMLLDQLTQNIVLKNNDEHSDPQAALLDINVERVINDIKTMETVLNKQENISSTPSSPNPSRNRSVSHSYTQRHKHQQNRKKSLSRNISYDSSLNHSLSDISFSGDISRNSIKRRTTAYTSYSKKKKHYSYGKKAKYVVLKTSLVKKINEIASLNAQLNEKKKELNALEQTLDRQAKEASRRDDLESSFYMSESSSFNDLKYNLKSASSTESFNGNSMILKDSDLEINDSSIMDESFLSSSTSSPLLSSRLSAIGKNNSRSSLILNSPSKNVVVPETTTNGKSISNSMVSTNIPPPPPPPPVIFTSTDNITITSSKSNIPPPPPPPPIMITNTNSDTITSTNIPPPPPPPVVSTNTNNNTNDTTNDTQKINIPPPPPPPPPPMMQSSNNSNIPLPPPPPPIISSTNTVGALPPPPPPPPPSSLSSSNAPPPPPPPPPAGSNVPPAPPTPLTKNKNRFATMAVKAPALPGMMNKHVGILAKKTNLSSKPLKSLNWTKIPPYLISETIWKDIDDTIVLEELSDELPRFEDIFSAFQHKKKVVEQTDDQDSQLVKAKPKLVTFLDPKRSQNCCIMLRAVKLDSKQIKQALMTADHHNLSKDIIPELLKFCPTEEEYALVKMYEATDEKFDLAEQFFLDISKIDHYEDRLKALQFKCCFQEYVDDIFTMINWYDSATNDLIKSKNFKNVLKIILALGNYMNSGNRGGAYGFQISSIAKLVDTKTVYNNRRISLMNYLVNLIQNTYPDVLQFRDELKHIEDGVKVNPSIIQGLFVVMKAGIRDIKSLVRVLKRQKNNKIKKSETDKEIQGEGMKNENEKDKKEEKEKDKDKEVKDEDKEKNREEKDKDKEVKEEEKEKEEKDIFSDVMEEFLEKAINKSESLDKMYENAQKQYQKVLKLFGEDSKKTPEEFFEIFNIFIQEFDEAKQDNEKAEKQALQKKKREKMLKEQKEKRELMKEKKLLNRKFSEMNLSSLTKNSDQYGALNEVTLEDVKEKFKALSIRDTKTETIIEEDTEETKTNTLTKKSSADSTFTSTTSTSISTSFAKSKADNEREEEEKKQNVNSTTALTNMNINEGSVNVKKEKITTTVTTTQTITTTTTTTTTVESEAVNTKQNKIKINVDLQTPIENEIVSPNGSKKINLLKKIKSVPNIQVDDSVIYAYSNEDSIYENNDLKEQSTIIEESDEDENQQKLDFIIYDVISGRAFSNDNKLIS
jgi:hypothetical protein